MKIIPVLKSVVLGSVFSSAVAVSKPVVTKPVINHTADIFVKENIPAKGTKNIKVLIKAPNAKVVIKGVKKTAKYVVDLTENILYRYDEKGVPKEAFLVGSGKKTTPTHSGVRIVSHVEKYPYKGAPRNSKRRRNPKAYGPKIIILDKLDTKTGETSPIGEFIHGNADSLSIGKYVSHGCIRMDNDVILQLTEDVKSGDIVVILPNKKK